MASNVATGQPIVMKNVNVATPQLAKEYIVRVPESKNRSHHVMRFNNALKIDVKTWTEAKLERENNIKEFKLDDDIPKYGAGSEFGREQREEARRKKYGIITKKYNPNDQPWMLELGGKGGKKFKGIREGGVTENTSYYVFTQAGDGAFEAIPIVEWYNFAPIQRYKALSAEEAEEQFSKRDKLLNYFSLMSRKRMKKEDEGEGEESKARGKKTKKEFKISDMDEWITDSDDDDNEDNDENNKGSDEENSRKTKKKNVKGDDKKKKKEKASDEEAIEESDEGDFDDREVDYMSATSSSSEEEPEEEKVNREMKGVEDEDALRKIDASEDEEETPENKDTPETEEPVAEDKSAANAKTKQKKSEAASSGDSTSESSDSDFDDNKFHSAMFMQKPKKNGSDNSASSSRANTPTKMTEGKKKRKMGNSEFSPATKKFKRESHPGIPTMSNYSGNDSIAEDSVRRYLMRKPMTTTELLQKFKSKKTGLNSAQLVTTIAQILKRLNPEKQKIKGKLYLSIKS